MSLIEDKSMCKNGMYTVNQQTPEPDTPVTLSQAETLELENQSIFSFYESDSLSYLYNAIYYDYESIDWMTVEGNIQEHEVDMNSSGYPFIDW